MSGALAGGLLLGVASAGAIGGGFALQHRGAAGLPPLVIRRPLGSLASLTRAPTWVGGFVLGLAGWGTYVAALRLAPLSLVQAASAGGVVVLVFAGGRPSLREGLGAVAALAGLALLGLSLTGATGGGNASPLVLSAWLVASAVVAAVAARAAGRVLAGGAGLGTAAGVLYATADVATKDAVEGGVRLVLVPIVLAASGLAFAALQLGFQRGSRMATAGLATLWTNALPIVAGMVVFHEQFPPGAPGAARIVAFVVLVAAATVLARSQRVSLTDQSINQRPEVPWSRSTRARQQVSPSR
jgi:hypothetical protein